MSRGQHAAGDRSFKRSAGSAMARGVLLVVVAVGVGILLLTRLDDPTPVRVAAKSTTTTTSTAGPASGTGSTTTSAPKTARNPAEVTVLVANGSGISGAASKVSTALGAANYRTVKATDAKSTAEASAVYYQPGYELDARAVVALLKPGVRVAPMPSPLPVADLAGANIVVVLAADLAKA